VRVGVRQQGQVAGALDGSGQLALILGLGAGDPARDDLAALGNIGLEQVQILV